MINPRRSRSRIRESQAPQLLHERMLPKQLPIPREARKKPLRALNIYVTGFCIYRRTRSRIAQINSVAQEVVKTMNPELLACFSVEARHCLLQVWTVALIAVDIKTAIRDHWSALTREVDSPQGLFCVNNRRQLGLWRNAVLKRSAPFQPTLHGSGFVSGGGRIVRLIWVRFFLSGQRGGSEEQPAKDRKGREGGKFHGDERKRRKRPI